MTMIDTNHIKCKYCGEPNEVVYVRSTTTFDGPSLDSRPSPMANNLFIYNCYYCKNCNYSYLMNTKANGKNLSDVIESEEYQNIIVTVKDTYVRRFLLSAIIHKSISEYTNEAYSYLYAAWVYDNNHLETINKNPYYKIAGEKFYNIKNENIDKKLMHTDILRKASEFDKAKEIASEALNDNPNDTLKILLEAEVKLIDYECNYNFKTTDFLKPKREDFTSVKEMKKVLFSKKISKNMLLRTDIMLPVSGVPLEVKKIDKRFYLLFLTNKESIIIYELIGGEDLLAYKLIRNNKRLERKVKELYPNYKINMI